MSRATDPTSEGNQYLVTTEREEGRPITESIVAAIAAVEGVPPGELPTRLYDSLDPDALDDLCRSVDERGESLRLAFTLGGYEVVVDGGHRITVRDAPPDPRP